MEIKCPSCRKINRYDNNTCSDKKQCKRCGGDVSRLFTVLQTAKNKINQSMKSFLCKDPDTALILAKESWELKHSAQAAKLIFFSCVAKNEYELAYSWYLRSRT